MASKASEQIYDVNALTKILTKEDLDPLPRVGELQDVAELEQDDRKNQPPVAQISEEALNELNDSFDPLGTLGIPVGEDGKLPEIAGVPRIFVIKHDPKTGHDRIMRLEEAGTPLKSREFWQEAQKGNVLALASGIPAPLQINVLFTGWRKDVPMLSFRQVDSGPLPKPPEPKRPALWKYIVHFFDRKRYADEFWKWNHQEVLEAGHKATSGQMGAVFDARRGKLNREVEEAAEHQAELIAAEDTAQEERQRKQEEDARRREIMKEENLINRAVDAAESKKAGLKLYKDTVAPNPILHANQLTVVRNGNITKKGYYTQENFDKLETIKGKYSNIMVGKEAVSEEEYSGLVAICSMSPKHAEAGFQRTQEYDPTLKQSMLNAKFSEEQASEIIAQTYSDMTNVDLMKTNPSSDQDRFLETNVNPGRKDAMQLLKDYDKGNKDGLAQAIAYGVKHVVGGTSRQFVAFTNERHNMNRLTNAAAGLLTRDPELLKIATEKYGLDYSDVLVLKGLNEMDKADTARKEAEKKLAIAKRIRNELSDEEKRKCARDILVANLMEQKLLAENEMHKKELGNNDPRSKEEERLYAGCEEKNLVSQPRTEDRPLPPEGFFYYDQILTLMNGRSAEFNAHPLEVHGWSRPKTVSTYGEMAEWLIDRDRVDKLDGITLMKTLRSEKYQGIQLVKNGADAIKALKRQEKQEAQVMDDFETDLEPLNINEERKMRGLSV